jgi:chromosome partitioning protein
MIFQNTHIIALANQKGGCGKTTTTVSLATALVEEGLNVTVVDTDPQCNATDTFAIDRDQLAVEGKYTLADALLAKVPARQIELDFPQRFHQRLSVIPGHKGIGTVSHRLETQMQAAIANGEYSDLDADDVKNEHRHRLRQSLDALRLSRDIILIDTPPDLGFLMTTALIASDWYIIPMFPSGYDLKGLETLLNNVGKVKERYNPRLGLLGVLLGNTDQRAKLDSDIHAMLVDTFGPDFVFQTLITRSVKHREATVNGLTILEHAAGQPAAEQYRALAREVIERISAAENANQREAPELAAVNRG